MKYTCQACKGKGVIEGEPCRLCENGQVVIRSPQYYFEKLLNPRTLKPWTTMVPSIGALDYPSHSYDFVSLYIWQRLSRAIGRKTLGRPIALQADVMPEVEKVISELLNMIKKELTERERRRLEEEAEDY